MSDFDHTRPPRWRRFILAALGVVSRVADVVSAILTYLTFRQR
jgi:hypothetical protein